MKTIYTLLLLISCFFACSKKQDIAGDYIDRYNQILDITYVPDTLYGGKGWFSDQGAWIGFTLPSVGSHLNGFCGPYDLDSRYWLSQSLLQVGDLSGSSDFIVDSTNYLPGKIEIFSSDQKSDMSQILRFIDKNHVLLSCYSKDINEWIISGSVNSGLNIRTISDGKNLFFRQPGGEVLMLTFPSSAQLTVEGNSYKTIMREESFVYVVLSYFNREQELTAGISQANKIINHPDSFISLQTNRWNDYLQKIYRPDLSDTYNRIAAKSVVTLMSNWRSAKGALLHDGVVPSHAVGYFVGFWAWDSWKHAYALATFAPELAKDQIRTMFDYQLPDGMIIDCIYTDSSENNARDSKPPLAVWAVNRIFTQTNDTAFVREIYPQLLSYHKWWFRDRDHNQNGICEFGSVDGTTEAAKWESGMDNAIRFDQTRMLQNSDSAWSFDQESVDLNAFLLYENQLLRKLSGVAGVDVKDIPEMDFNIDYFFDSEDGFFYDKNLNGNFIKEAGCEAYIPFWSELATKEQAQRAMSFFTDTAKFSTYIPFPTVAADNPQFMPKGYWRGPIWLDQVYFGINGIRNYGYTEQADKYTEQVFDRLKGLQGSSPIHENYGTHTGEVLKAPHFSWSAAHLLMLFEEYKRPD